VINEEDLPKEEMPEPSDFSGQFYKVYKELMSILLKLFQIMWSGVNTFKLILWEHHFPDSKIRQEHNEKN
jgi:hypothetical protein